MVGLAEEIEGKQHGAGVGREIFAVARHPSSETLPAFIYNTPRIEPVDEIVGVPFHEALGFEELELVQIGLERGNFVLKRRGIGRVCFQLFLLGVQLCFEAFDLDIANLTFERRICSTFLREQGLEVAQGFVKVFFLGVEFAEFALDHRIVRVLGQSLELLLDEVGDHILGADDTRFLLQGNGFVLVLESVAEGPIAFPTATGHRAFGCRILGALLCFEIVRVDLEQVIIGFAGQIVLSRRDIRARQPVQRLGVLGIEPVYVSSV